MILVLKDRYESPLSIDSKKLPIALHLTSQWRVDDVRVTKNWILRILDENRPNFKFSTKNLRNMRFWWSFWLIVKGNDYYKIHRRFQVHSTNIFVWEQKQVSQGGNHLPIRNFDSFPYLLFCANMTGKDDPTINCTYLMVKLTLTWPRYFYSRWCPRGGGFLGTQA